MLQRLQHHVHQWMQCGACFRAGFLKILSAKVLAIGARKAIV